MKSPPLDYQGSPCPRLLILRNHWGKETVTLSSTLRGKMPLSGYILSSPQDTMNLSLALRGPERYTSTQYFVFLMASPSWHHRMKWQSFPAFACPQAQCVHVHSSTDVLMNSVSGCAVPRVSSPPALEGLLPPILVTTTLIWTNFDRRTVSQAAF